MKKSGIINGELIYHIAMLGHKDLFMIGDAGMPIPEGVTVIDLAIRTGEFSPYPNVILQAGVVFG